MEMKEIRERIKAYVSEMGEMDVAFCHAGNFDFIEEIYRDRAQKGHACSFEWIEEVRDRIEPARHLEGAASFIVLAVPYRMELETKPEEPVTVKMAYGTNMLDYHKIVMPILARLGRFIEAVWQVKWQAYCDTGPFSDRAVARRAGLGRVARNSYLIHPAYGLSFFIGYLLTDMDLAEEAIEEARPFVDVEDLCIGCARCVKACPNGAILGNGQINANSCISYLTQAKTLTEGQEKMLNGSLYGCDICHLVCPKHHSSIEALEKLEANEPLVPAYIGADKLLSLSNKGMKEYLGVTAAGWRSKKILQRNAEIEKNMNIRNK